MIITVTLEGNPLGKGRPRFGRGRVFTPAKTMAYEKALGLTANIAMRGHPRFSGLIRVSIFAFHPIPKKTSRAVRLAMMKHQVRPIGKPDIDNIAKMALDALNEIVWNDDSQIVDLHVIRYYSDQPALTVAIDDDLGES